MIKFSKKIFPFAWFIQATVLSLFFCVTNVQAANLKECGSQLKSWSKLSPVAEAVLPADAEGFDAHQNELRSMVTMTIQQAKDLGQVGGLIRLSDLLANKSFRVEEGARKRYLLGPQGREANAILRQGRFRNFWEAYRDVGMDPHQELNTTYVTRFLRALILDDRRQVFYFVPDDLTVDTKTVEEFEIMAAHPELMSRVIFIYGKADCKLATWLTSKPWFRSLANHISRSCESN